MAVLNLGILAHVDAGKTSLTERILYQTGVLDRPGSVDAGSTLTDSMALERERGITIRSAVVSFTVGDLKVNLIDTPGHADFIAEVERALRVLDGVVLVVSAVEGVQPQTRRLMRTLLALRIPTLLFVNKVDRTGAREDGLLDRIRARLTPYIVPVSTVTGIGTAAARTSPVPVAGAAVTDLLADRRADADEAFLAEYVARGWHPSPAELSAELRRQSRAGRAHPVYFGSAMTGTGVAELLDGIVEYLPAASGDGGAALSGTVFALQRGRRGERVAYVRLFAGTLRNRRPVTFFRDGTDPYEARPTGVALFDNGRSVPVDMAPAGEIAQVTGLPAVRIGDRVGTPSPVPPAAFPPPTLESVVTPTDRGRSDLYAALCRLADQDPMIRIRTVGDEISVCLFGEVQKEVVAATLATEYGIGVTFAPTRTICVEKPAGVGEAVEYITDDGNPFFATVGLRVEPGEGIGYRIAVEPGSLLPSFLDAIGETVVEELRQGPHGWQVTDCLVTLTHTGYWSRPFSAAGDFRRLTPLVLAEALRRAGTVVYQPVWRFALTVPAGTAGDAVAALARVGGAPHDIRTRDGVAELAGTIPADAVHGFERTLPRVTSGEGDFTATADDVGYVALPGAPPTRSRSGPDPLNRKEYLRLLKSH